MIREEIGIEVMDPLLDMVEEEGEDRGEMKKTDFEVSFFSIRKKWSLFISRVPFFSQNNWGGRM